MPLTDIPTLTTPTAGSRYWPALEHGYRNLRFEAGLEQEFEWFSNTVNLVRVRWAAALAFTLFGLFVFVDLLTLPREVAVWTAGIRLGVIMPASVIVLLTTVRERGRRQLQRIVLGASLVTGLGTVGVIGAALLHEHALPYEGILLVALFISLLSCLTWRRALLANGVTLVAFVAMELALQPDPDARLYQIIFMVAANIVGAWGGYFLERSTRTTFLVQGMLGELAERDGLTGLHNRRALDRHLEQVWRQAVRDDAGIAMAMIDVDHFKRFNDRYGHAEGDAALRLVAAAIGAQARRPLDLAARYGGEEFAVVWYRPAPADLPVLGEQLRTAVLALEREHLDSGGGRLSISVGIAYLRPTPDQDVCELVRRADEALYRAKQGGRDRVET